MEAASSQKSWHTYQSAQCPAQKTVIFIFTGMRTSKLINGQMVCLSHEKTKSSKRLTPQIDNVRKWQLKGN